MAPSISLKRQAVIVGLIILQPIQDHARKFIDVGHCMEAHIFSCARYFPASARRLRATCPGLESSTVVISRTTRTPEVFYSRF